MIDKLTLTATADTGSGFGSAGASARASGLLIMILEWDDDGDCEFVCNRLHKYHLVPVPVSQYPVFQYQHPVPMERCQYHSRHCTLPQDLRACTTPISLVIPTTNRETRNDHLHSNSSVPFVQSIVKIHLIQLYFTNHSRSLLLLPTHWL